MLRRLESQLEVVRDTLEYSPKHLKTQFLVETSVVVVLTRILGRPSATNPLSTSGCVPIINW